MNWSETKKRLLTLAKGRREEWAGVDASSDEPLVLPSATDDAPIRAASLCVASGKGGTGKTVVSASLAHLFGGHGRTLIVDADMGVGNAHILQDVSPARSLVDVVDDVATVREVIVPCGGQIDLLGAGSGVPRMAELSPYEMHLMASGLCEIERDYGYLLVDSAAGVSRQTVTFAGACDMILIVTTPDLTAMTDAYAFYKVLLQSRADAEVRLLVNRATGEEEALEVAERIERVCRRFIGHSPGYLGWLPEDRAVPRCVNRRAPVVLLEPSSPMAYALRRSATRLIEELAVLEPAGFGRSLAVTYPPPARYA
jgi:flagellar biosynthesis protein FlhG